jgi:hypothetical protein
VFGINKIELKALKTRTFEELGSANVLKAHNCGLVMDLQCGCGAGGSCASSCVSGCSERG